MKNEKLRVNSKKYKFEKIGGITLISLVITIVVLIILASIGIYLSLGNNGIFKRAKQAKELTNKQEATDIINLKITTVQMNKYAEKQEMPTLQELADVLYEDNEIQYVALESKVADKEKIIVGDKTSIFTKLNYYPYEFEIDGQLRLASIDGIKIAKEETVTVPKEEYEELKNTVSQIRAGQITIGAIGKSSSKSVQIFFKEPMKNNNYSVVITAYNPFGGCEYTSFLAKYKTVDGFSIHATNSNTSYATAQMIVNYIVIPYTE